MHPLANMRREDVEPWDWSSGAQPYLLSGFSGIFSPVIIAAAVPPLPLSQVPIRLSILPAQMTREGELQAIRAVGALGSIDAIYFARARDRVPRRGT